MTGQEFVSICKADVCHTQSRANSGKKYHNKYTEYFGQRGYAGINKNGVFNKTYSYGVVGHCCIGVQYWLCKSGLSAFVPKSPKYLFNTNGYRKWLKNQPTIKGYGKVQWTTDRKKAKAGAIAFKGNGKNKTSATHTCVFIKYNGDYVYTVDFNVSDGKGHNNGTVKKRHKKYFVGFANMPYPAESKPTPKPVETVTYYVNTEVGGLNLRNGAGTNYDVVKTLSRGTKVEVSTITDGWAYLPNDKLYCSSKYLSKEKPTDRQKIPQTAYHPMKNHRVSCGWNDGSAHKKCSSSSANYRDFPTDLVGKDSGRDWAYAPCDMVVLRRYTKASHSIWLRSVEEVQTPYGVGYLYMMSEHQDNKEMGEVGHVYKQGQKMFREGKNGNATGNHLHVSFGFSKTKQTSKTMGTGWRKNSKGAWVLHIPKVTNIKINQAVYS